jgi:hypothetical protein
MPSMANPLTRLGKTLSHHKDEWYFMPLIGLFFLMVLLPGVLLAKSIDFPEKSDQESAEATPTPTTALSEI